MTHLVLASVAILAAAPGLRVSAAEDSKKPNVLFILTDDQRWDALGLGGARHLKTPNIDRLGNEGVFFKNAFCTTSLCSPSRASILSGLYAHAHGVVNNFTEYPGGLRSFPRVLQSRGYDTAYFGKWHMGEGNDEPRPGFNWFVTHKGQGKYFDNEFNINGTKREVVKGYYTHAVTGMAEEWLARDHGGKPWLLMIGHKAPHSFYFPEPKYEHAFDSVRVPYPETAFMLEALAHASGGLAALIDLSGTIFPEAPWAERKLLMIRPRCVEDGLRALDALSSSGAFDLLAFESSGFSHPLPEAIAVRIARLARETGSAVLACGTLSIFGSSCALRLELSSTQRGHVRALVTKSRQGALGEEITLSAPGPTLRRVA